MATEFEQKKELLTRRIVDKIVNDTAFREAIITNPAQALATAGFAKDMQELSETAQGEVSGYGFTDSWGCPTGISTFC